MAPLTATDRRLLLRLQRQALQYFLDNQTTAGLVLDRQRNRGPRRPHGLCSTAATGLPGARPLLRHGRTRDGRFLGCSWDRLNGETVFLYVLATGADRARALPPAAWRHLRPFYGTVAGRRFNNADLGLFVFQYGL